MDPLSKLDLAFCVDLTGSMGGFIAAARQHISRVLDALQQALGAGLRVAFVGYRDHSDGKLLLQVEALTGDVAKVRGVVDAAVVSGGGDAPEAVYTGLDACLKLAWADGSYRVVILVGDAPPHGVGAAGDSYKNDPSGYSLDDMANQLETEGVFVHALSMQPGDKVLESSFKRLSISTGGSYRDATSPAAAMEVVETFTKGFLADIEFDRRVLEVLRAGVEVPQPKHDDDVVPSRDELVAERLKVPVQQVWGGLMRLRRRRLLDGLE